MASKRKGKSGTHNRPPGRSGSLDSSEEAFVPEDFDVGSDYVPKGAYQALMRAFNDMKKKWISSKNEKKLQQEKNNNLIRQIKYLENQVAICASIEKENETLKEKVGLGFKAFDQKYKEFENLKKELAAAKEEASKHAEDVGKEQQDVVVEKEDNATQTKTSFDSSVGEKNTVDSFAQTSEEKTDDVGCVTPTKLLRNCGLEIVSQNGVFYLILGDRDLLRQWLENETDGKVSVSFEKTPVFERFVQTEQVFIYDTTKMAKEIHCEKCGENERITIQLKNKIVDQANLIKRYREQHLNMADLVRKTEPKKVLSLSVMVQTEGKFYDEHDMMERVKSLTKYKNTVSKSLLLLRQKSIQLNKELEYQNKFGIRLLTIISGTMHVPENFVTSVANAMQSKSQSAKIKKDKKPPVPRAYLGDESLEYLKALSPPESYASGPLLSIPVQETDRRLRIKISKPRDPDYDPSLDEEVASAPPAESRSLTSESSASIVPAEEAQHTLVVDNITSGTGGPGVLPIQPISGASSSSHRVGQASGSHDDSDEIVVIAENESGAVGSISGAKECPVCYFLHPPGTSQQEYEKHVMDHFVDFD